MSFYVTRKINTSEKQKRLFLVLACCILGMFLLYGYFIQTTIYTIVERSSIIKNTDQLNFDLGELESEYNKMRNILTYDYANSLGFYEVEEQIFAKRTRLAQGN